MHLKILANRLTYHFIQSIGEKLYPQIKIFVMHGGGGGAGDQGKKSNFLCYTWITITIRSLRNRILTKDGLLV